MTKSPATLLALSLPRALAACAKKEEPVAVKPADAAPPPAPAPDAAPQIVEVKEGLATPESVLYVADQDHFLVSNINGSPVDADDNGYIAKLSADGKTLEKWIDGAKDDVKLDAPKGSAILNGKLYVADITVVRVFDLATGKQEKDIAIKGATFLNDVAADATRVVVTDTGVGGDFKPNGSAAIYEIDGKSGKVKKLLADKTLAGPNGVIIAPDGAVWVNTFGGKEIFKIENGKKGQTLEVPAGGLDGMALLPDGRLVVSSWESKTLFAGKPGEAMVALKEGLESPADFAVDAKRGLLIVPNFTGNSLSFQPIP
jgi:sugar lactone lactonase YvrE